MGKNITFNILSVRPEGKDKSRIEVVFMVDGHYKGRHEFVVWNGRTQESVMEQISVYATKEFAPPAPRHFVNMTGGQFQVNSDDVNRFLDEPIDARRIKLIHTLSNRLGQTDKEYRVMLVTLKNVSSCKSLTNREADEVIDWLYANLEEAKVNA